MIRVWKDDVKDFAGLGMKLRYSNYVEFNNFFECTDDDIFEIEERYIQSENRFFELLALIEKEDFTTYVNLLGYYFNCNFAKLNDNDTIEKMLNSYYCWAKRVNVLRRLI